MNVIATYLAVFGGAAAGAQVARGAVRGAARLARGDTKGALAEAAGGLAAPVASAARQAQRNRPRPTTAALVTVPLPAR